MRRAVWLVLALAGCYDLDALDRYFGADQAVPFDAAGLVDLRTGGEEAGAVEAGGPIDLTVPRDVTTAIDRATEIDAAAPIDLSLAPDLSTPPDLRPPCNTMQADCNGDSTDGCETNLLFDVDNCGACRRACPPVNGMAPACNAGICGIACPLGSADCNGNLGDLCEVSLLTDARNCGACGDVCSGNHVLNNTPTCGAGSCNASCANGWFDCNRDKLTDGCESDPTSDPTNCGGCGNACSGNHVATPTCAMSKCGGTCDPGWSDCNSNRLTDGCETSTATSPANCGGCAMACSAVNVPSPRCTAGSCTGDCAPGYGDCDGDRRGTGCETNVLTDVKNCGQCARACSTSGMQTVTCTGGTCDGACKTGLLDCNRDKQVDGCEVDPYRDARNCGGCGMACSTQNVPSPSCSNGMCDGGCAQGFSDCNGNKRTDGCEINTAGDVNNCGGCGNACSGGHVPTPACSGGKCTGACATGFADCNNNKLSDGCESDLASPDTCGTCGNDCTRGTNTACLNGTCGCASLADCATGTSSACTGGTCRCGAGAGCMPKKEACTAQGFCKLAAGQGCTANADCASKMCSNGKCL